MSGIPYNKLMTVSTPVCDTDGNQVAEVSTSFAFVVPCKHCRKFHFDNSDHDYRSGWRCDRWGTDMVEPDGFCAWGEAERPQGDATWGR